MKLSALDNMTHFDGPKQKKLVPPERPELRPEYYDKLVELTMKAYEDQAVADLFAKPTFTFSDDSDTGFYNVRAT